jgi:cation transport ATPase
MKKAIAEHSTSHPFITVYVGDSDTDLPCLLQADVGIIIGNGVSLIETCKRVGIRVKTNQSLREIALSGNAEGGITFYHFNDWHCIIKSELIN